MVVSTLRACAISLGVASAVALSACARGTSAAPIAGSELYGACESCHGPSGQGDATFGAPSIAGLPAWYLILQLQRFQQGLRGKHPDDVEGLKMRAMSRQMLSDAEIAAVASHVAALPAAKNAATTAGDSALGQQAYTLCVPCHGAKGEGNEAVKAPPLAGMDDWYVAAQIRKFKAGVRGTVADDPVGPIMRAMSLAIPPEQVDHLAAFAHGLR
jgi:cytochrome c oxidase subunit 2